MMLRNLGLGAAWMKDGTLLQRSEAVLDFGRSPLI